MLSTTPQMLLLTSWRLTAPPFESWGSVALPSLAVQALRILMKVSSAGFPKSRFMCKYTGLYRGLYRGYLGFRVSQN